MLLILVDLVGRRDHGDGGKERGEVSSSSSQISWDSVMVLRRNRVTLNRSLSLVVGVRGSLDWDRGRPWLRGLMR